MDIIYLLFCTTLMYCNKLPVYTVDLDHFLHCQINFVHMQLNDDCQFLQEQPIHHLPDHHLSHQSILELLLEGLLEELSYWLVLY